MVELFGEEWRLRLHAFRPGAAVAEGLRALPEEPLGGALEDGLLEVDIFDGGSDAPSGAFTDGSRGIRSDQELYQVLESQLQPDQSLSEFERQVLRASATLTVRHQSIAPGAVERALAGARIRDAARNDERGVVPYLEARLNRELDVPGDNNAIVESLVNMLQTERRAQGSPSGLRALMAPLPRSAPVSPPPRRLCGSGGPVGGGSRDAGGNSQEAPEVDTLPGLAQPTESGRVADPAEPATMAGALDRLAAVPVSYTHLTLPTKA